MLRVDGATVRFDGRPVVDAVDLELAGPETVALLGPSGSGKSTLLRAIAGLQPLSEGTVTWDGRDLAPVPPHERRFGLMFQEYALFPHRDVAGNVEFGLRMAGVGARERGPRVEAALERVGLAGLRERRVATLSGGEQQRVALARALVVAPRLLMLDEPLGALDQVWRGRLLGEIASVLAREALPAIYVTHDHDEAFALAGRVVIMRDGRVVQTGTPIDVWRHPVDAWTATFFGFGPVVAGEVRADRVCTPWGELPVPPRTPPGAVDVVLRPDGVHVGEGGPITARIARLQFRGTRVEMEAQPANGPPLTVAVGTDTALAVGEQISLAVNPDAVLVFARTAN